MGRPIDSAVAVRGSGDESSVAQATIRLHTRLAVGAPYEALRVGRVVSIDSALVVHGAGDECSVVQFGKPVSVIGDC